MRRTPRSILTRCKNLVGARIRLTRVVTTVGGEKYAIGTLWRVSATWRGRFSIVGITASGRDEMKNGCIARYVRGVAEYSFELAP